jgi:hypothetical protein
VALYWLPDRATAPTSADFEAPDTTAHLAYLTNLTVPGGAIIPALVLIDGITPVGGPAWLQIRAWENVLGVTDTWEQAIVSTDATGTRGALCGTSNIARIDTGEPGSLDSLANTWPTLNGFTLIVVPEPSVIGLGVLGLGGLLLFRRRD